MKEFKTYHPIVNFAYFVFVIVFSCLFFHPVCLIISLFSGFTYLVMLKDGGKIKKNLSYMIPMFLFVALINPIFNHRGVTIITYLPWGNPLTFESVVYGFCASAMIVSVICHFSCYNEIMTSDKFIYLFGKIIPGLSLILSMTLRFAPSFARSFKAVADSQKCMGRDITKGNIIKRAKSALDILSIVTTHALESAIETSDSMKSRGYGGSKRTAFSIYTFDRRDKKALIFILFLGIYTFSGYLTGEMSLEFFPSVVLSKVSVFGISTFISYFVLCIYPVIIGIREVRRWKA